MQPFSFLEFEVSELSPEVAAFLIMAASVSIGFLVGWCVRPDDHTQEDDKQAKKPIRLGRSWRNLFGFWSN